MAKEDIISIAREAGLGAALTHNNGEPRIFIEGADWHDELVRFAELLEAKVRADERKVLEQALEALEVVTDTYDDNAVGIEIDAIIALRKRLAQPEREWQRLTDEEYNRLVMEHLGPHALTGGKMSVYDAFLLAIRATEAKLKEKND